LDEGNFVVPNLVIPLLFLVDFKTIEICRRSPVALKTRGIDDILFLWNSLMLYGILYIEKIFAWKKDFNLG